jgi:outer membrane immunogenic protein
MKTILLASLLIGTFASAETTTSAEFDSLGGNRIMLERAEALAPDQNVSVVQNRMVPRQRRFEISPEISGTFGGDTYTRTRSFGLNLNYHISSRWSLGAKYNHSFNQLTDEGEAMVNRAYEDFIQNPENPSSSYPQINFPRSESMALVNFYPFYGKISLIDEAVAHFDFYFIGGYGQVKLNDGPTSTYTAGAGLGFWLSHHFTTRMEMRYQNYKAKYLSGEKNMDLAIASFQMGWLL